MKMMSLTQFRNNIFQAFDLMKNTRASFEIYHRRKVYRLWVEVTDQKIDIPYKLTRRTNVPTALIDSKPCTACNSLLVNGICMNRNCPTAKKTP